MSVVPPTIAAPASVVQGDQLEVDLGNLTPNGQWAAFFSTADIPVPLEQNPVQGTADNEGLATFVWDIRPDATPGSYLIHAFDQAKGVQSSKLLQIVQASPPTISAPSSVEQGKQLNVRLSNLSPGDRWFAFFQSPPPIPVPLEQNPMEGIADNNGEAEFAWDILQDAVLGTYVIFAVDEVKNLQSTKQIEIIEGIPEPIKRNLNIDNSITIRTTAPTTDQNVEYPISFDPTEWRVTQVGWSINANQSLNILSTQFLDLGVLIISYNSQGVGFATGDLGQHTLSWGPLEATETKNWSAGRTVSHTGAPPASVGIRVNHRYRMGLPTVTEQTVDISEALVVTLEAIVENPTTEPNVGPPDVTDTNPPPGEGWDIGGFFGGLGTGVLLAGAGILALLILTRR